MVSLKVGSIMPMTGSRFSQSRLSKLELGSSLKNWACFASIRHVDAAAVAGNGNGNGS